MPRDKQPLLIEVAIEPRSKTNREKLGAALAKLTAEDTSFKVETDMESGQSILRGTGELHLDNKIDVLKRTYNIDLNIGAPQVAYREKITRQATVDYTYRKQLAGRGQYARVKIVAQPCEPGTGFAFESKIADGAIPTGFIASVEEGLKSQLTSGVIAGFPVIDLKVSLIDGTSHDVDSSAMTFEIAARAAMREALRKGDPVLLQPIMKVEVVSPHEYAPLIMGELKSRRGQIRAQDMRGNANVILAIVPLANMFSYFNNLRSMSEGRATFTMQFDHYAVVPRDDDSPPFQPASGMRP